MNEDIEEGFAKGKLRGVRPVLDKDASHSAVDEAWQDSWREHDGWAIRQAAPGQQERVVRHVRPLSEIGQAAQPQAAAADQPLKQ